MRRRQCVVTFESAGCDGDRECSVQDPPSIGGKPMHAQPAKRLPRQSIGVVPAEDLGGISQQRGQFGLGYLAEQSVALAGAAGPSADLEADR